MADPYDVLVPIGLRCSVFSKQVCQEIGRGKIIFTAVRDPLVHKLIDSLESPGPDMTAVIPEVASNTAVAEKLAIAAQYIKRIIVPYIAMGDYDPLHEQAAEIAEFFRPYGIEVEPILIFSQGRMTKIELEKALKDRLRKHDVILIMESAIPDAYAETAYFAFERDAMLCADTLSSMYTGAAFAFGCELHLAAMALRDTLITHWVDGVPLGDIPVKVIPDERVFFANITILRMIGFPEEAIALFEKAEDVIAIKKWVNCPIDRGV